MATFTSNHLTDLPNELIDIIYNMKEQLEIDDMFRNMETVLEQFKTSFGGNKPRFTEVKVVLQRKGCQNTTGKAKIIQDYLDYWGRAIDESESDVVGAIDSSSSSSDGDGDSESDVGGAIVYVDTETDTSEADPDSDSDYVIGDV